MSTRMAPKISVAILDIPDDGGKVYCTVFRKGDKLAQGSSASLDSGTERAARDWICGLMEEWRPMYLTSNEPSGDISARFHSFAIGAGVVVGAEYCMLPPLEVQGDDKFHSMALTARKIINTYLNLDSKDVTGVYDA